MKRYFCGVLILVLITSPAAGEENPHPLLELLSSRDEVVQIAGYGEDKLSTVLITGSVSCDCEAHACPIQGAWVGVKCVQRHGRKSKSVVVARGVSDEFGEFMIDLPSQLHAIPNLEKACTLQLHHYRFLVNNKLITLSSFGNGIRTYSAGNIKIIL